LDYINVIIRELNRQHVKAVKLKGEFVWHTHEYEDELFLVVKGTFNMELRDKNVTGLGLLKYGNKYSESRNR